MMVTVTFTLLYVSSFTLLLSGVKAEVFTAVADVEPLLETHRNVIDNIEEYVQLQQERINLLYKYLKLYKREHQKMEEDIAKYVGHPLNMYTLIKRLTVDLNLIEYMYSAGASVEFPKRPNGLVYPTAEDLEGSAAALSRLQETYRLNVTELAKGTLTGTFSHGNKQFREETYPTTAGDCFEIGRILYEAKDQKKALPWFLQALDKLENRAEDDTSIVAENIVVDFIRTSYHELNDVDNALLWTKRFLALQPEHHSSLYQMIDHYNDRKAKELQNKSKEATAVVEDRTKRVYEALCRGEIPMPAHKAKSLRCIYTTGPDPFLLLAPIKTEQLHMDPAVLMFHDVISDSEIAIVQRLAQPKFSRATVHDDAGKPIPAKYRISKSGWLDDSDPTIAKISRRVSDFTGLSMETAELLQVANYGIGGHYETHYDFLKKKQTESKDGNRIATVLFYMSDVEQGGATAFVDLEVTVFPVKHSAIFWMNLHPSGVPDLKTRHAACPVLRGSKWVCNKWIHSGSQEFLRPCTLEYQE